jgi:hypothetical protein
MLHAHFFKTYDCDENHVQTPSLNNTKENEIANFKYKTTCFVNSSPSSNW